MNGLKDDLGQVAIDSWAAPQYIDKIDELPEEVIKVAAVKLEQLVD